jgi:alpha-mannosidase
VLQDFLVPVPMTFDAQDVTRLTGGRAPVQASGVDEHFFRWPTHADLVLRPDASVVRIQGDHLVFSTFKRTEDGTRSVVRVFNPSDDQTSLTLEADGGMRAASVLMLNEEKVQDVEVAENRTESIPVGPGQIVTVGFS